MAGACVVLGLTSVGAVAHVRLHNPANKAPLFWQSPGEIGIVIGAQGTSGLSDGSHETAIRNAIAAWNSVTGTTSRLVEDASPESQARTDWESDDVHLVLFDEDNSSGYFPTGSGTVAITPIWFFSSGRISDADVLFNAKGFNFTTSLEASKFDVQDVATHELGHLLGLDHSGWAGGTMYPFVDPTVILHRSLSLDELAGLRDVYPSQAYGILRGRVMRADGRGVPGAHVVARTPAGRTAGGTLAEGDGTFLLRGLSAGTYVVYAAPLDEPVSAANLTSGHLVEVDFESTLYPEPAVLNDGQTTDLGDLVVGEDVALNLGRSFDRYPRRVIAGLTSWIIIRGTGLVHGSTLQCSDPAVTVVPLDWVGFQVNFQVLVPEGAPPGHVDLTVVDPDGKRSILPAALEITPPSPVVTSITPAMGGAEGGQEVVLTGTGFLPGCRVVLGGEIYVEGQDADLTLVDGTTLRLVTRPAALGLYDATVIDASGVEGRLADAYEVAPVPDITSVFPKAGASGGGTPVVVEGTGFLEGATVLIGGAPQSHVTRIDATRLELTTDPGSPGGPYEVEVVNPGGYLATLPEAFAYVEADDPVLSAVSPAEGGEEGGESVTLQGANLGEATQVFFGVDPATGEGGVPAPDVSYEDSGTLVVVTPSHPPGPVSVMALDPATGQMTILPTAFTFKAAPASGGGCATVSPARPAGLRDVLGGSGWIPALALLLVLKRRAAIRSAPAAR